MRFRRLSMRRARDPFESLRWNLYAARLKSCSAIMRRKQSFAACAPEWPAFSADETDEVWKIYVLAARQSRGHREVEKDMGVPSGEQRREEALEKVNAYRERLVERFEPFAEKMRKKGKYAALLCDGTV